MFLLSIIPLPLIADYKPKDPNSKFESLEYKVMQLEGFLTAATLDLTYPTLDSTYPTVYSITSQENSNLNKIYYTNNEMNFNAINKDLEKAKQTLTSYLEQNHDINIPGTLDFSSINPVSRATEIENKLLVASERISDLTTLRNALLKGEVSSGTEVDIDPYTIGIQSVSGLNTVNNPNGISDINVVKKELKRVKEYYKELYNEKIFWDKTEKTYKDIVSNNVKTVSKDEMLNNELTGIKRFEQLHDLLNSLIKDVEYDAKPDVPGIQHLTGLTTEQNPDGYRDANVVRERIEKVKFYLEIKIQAAKKQTWYPELKTEIQSRLSKIEKERKNAEKIASALEKQLYGMMQNPSNCTGDPNMIRQNLYRQRALIGSLNSENQLLRDFLKPDTKSNVKTTEIKPDKPSNTATKTNNPSKKFSYSVSYLPPKIDHSYDFTGLNGKKKKKNH